LKFATAKVSKFERFPKKIKDLSRISKKN
jgi:hypothetical protein